MVILWNVHCEVGILGFERRQQSRSFDRLLLLPVQLYFGLRRGDLEIFADAIRASIKENLRKYNVVSFIFSKFYTIFFALDLDYGHSVEFGDLSPRVDSEIFAGNVHCEVGILGFERRQQSRSFDRLLLLPVQLCFGLRRGDLEILADAIRASIKENLRKYNVVSFIFSKFYTIFFALDLEYGHFVEFGDLSPRVDSEIFTDAIRVSINEE
uniref:Uncharacterized protein n=1 Tax=Vespula pensylvanica TaxID=30213 RepID=A0A834JYD6_VESPE|nr:hypothetical protein H0235_016475 [Vespula pensylvanica]